jgi:UDP-N-acetylmuramoyl-tripeptide--D-alanyl-D-alanine ligase
MCTTISRPLWPELSRNSWANEMLSLYLPGYARTLVYMLQSTEYQALPYLAWYWRTKDFRAVSRRRQLDKTGAARILQAALETGILLQLLVSIILLLRSIQTGSIVQLIIGAVLFAAYPIMWAHLVLVPLVLGNWLIIKPRERHLIERSKAIFADHPATIIAVAGSYGKTSMKELLLTVLSEGKKVAATPANKNVAVSHAAFAASLNGDEEILIIEYGEGKPGDVQRFCEYTQPDIGVITGLAPAHLDQYKTLEAAGQDIFSLVNYLKDQKVYVNAESNAAQPFIRPSHLLYSSEKVLGWAISDIVVKIDGTSFTMKKSDKVLRLKSKLLGKHQVGPLALAAALANDLGLTREQIERGVGKTAPFEHRMQARRLHGAWIIDDTYNGNIDGVRAGLQLLQDLPANRKIYVTPGLVDQGEEANKVHYQMGKLIAAANPNQVVLMQNSAEPQIQKGLQEANYTGVVRAESDPLTFYNSLEHFIAAGDLVLLQNDWTDNYK